MSTEENSIWITAPEWLKRAYHDDTVVNAAIRESVYEGFNERDTLLLVIKTLLFRDALRLDQISQLQAKVSITVPITFRQEYENQFWNE